MRISLTACFFVLWSVFAAGIQAQQTAPAPKTKTAPETGKPSAAGASGRILVNQVGYLPHGPKHFLVEDKAPAIAETFSVVDINRQDEPSVLSGKLTRSKGDFGTYFVGRFSALTAPGKYAIRLSSPVSQKTVSQKTLPANSPQEVFTSYAFRIAPDVYADAMAKGVNYFAVQRCGPSTTGYNAPCHLDDGRTKDGKSVDLVGGWHCAGGLCKWPGFELAGMSALLNVAKLSADQELRSRIYEEVQWGNLYCLKMISSGRYIGSDTDGLTNRGTDNKSGTADDRPARPGAKGISNRHQFIAAEALLVSVYGDRDRAYADKCLDAARQCFAKVKQEKAGAYMDLGTGISAGLRLFEATKDEQYKSYAVRMADGFLKLQQTEYAGNQNKVRGYFFRSDKRREGIGVRTVHPLPLIALCDLAEAFPKHPQAGRWREAIKLHCQQYLGEIASRNAFGIVPYVAQPSGCKTRKAGDLGYRYFMCPAKHRYWVGNNANLAGAGIALLKAARILNQPELAVLAQRQLDWILGANPFGVSTVIHVGPGNPPEYVYTGFKPRVPFIPGAVMLGIGGDETDRPILKPGSFHTGEFSISRVYAFIWLLAEILKL